MLIRFGFSVFAVLIGVSVALPQAKNTDPQRTLWSNIKQQLMSKNGDKYFKESILDVRLPILRGTILSADSLENPEVIMLAMTKKTTPEVKLQVVEQEVDIRELRPASLRRRVAVGDEIEFMGLGAAFAKKPFLLTFNVVVDDVTYLPRQRKAR